MDINNKDYLYKAEKKNAKTNKIIKMGLKINKKLYIKSRYKTQ